LFLGFVIAFSLWFIFLPGATAESLFDTQLNTISAINSQATAGSITGAYSTRFLNDIISNNLKVLFFCLFFSFFYGAGAIFILTWNASVISAAIGTFVRNNIEVYAASVGLFKVAGYMHIFSMGLLRYMTHGIFEILAYFVAALAGGLISIAVMKHNIGTEKFRIVMKDALILTLIAAILIVAAGLIEVYITPVLV
ncbi:MAG: stage II sporulation protein M, partial [archaeon]